MMPVPLTYSQRFMYDLYSRGARSLQIPMCVRIKGHTDPEDFKRAAASLAARNPIMTSRLELIDGEPTQRQGDQAVSVEFLDITGSPDPQAAGLLLAQADAPVDLFRDSPFRFVVARVGADEVLFMLVGHHLYIDLTGLRGLLIDYLNLLTGRPLSTPATPQLEADRSFLAYAIAEQKMISEGIYAKRGQYWASRLSEADPALHFPGRGADPQHQSPSTVTFKLDGDSYQEFSDRARRLRVSHFALASTALFHGLRQATGQDNILLSLIIDTRRPPFHRAFGNFVGTSYIQQRASDAGASEESIRAVSREIALSIANYVPQSVFSSEVGWMGERLAKKFSTTETHVNYAPVRSSISSIFKNSSCEIEYFSLKGRDLRPRLPYMGVVLDIKMFPTPGALSGSIGFETAVVTPDIAQGIVSTMLSSLA